MVKQKVIFTAIIFFGIFSFAQNSQAASWYVDNAATGSNNGASWINAWQSFANIVWSSIVPGDTLYISGGAISKIYDERLNIGASGNISGGSINIRVGQTSPHNGKVIIHSNYYEGIVVSNQSYITISGEVSGSRSIQVENSVSSGVGLAGAVDHIKIEYLEINNNGSGDPNSGIEFNSLFTPADWEIAHCYIHDNYQDELHLSGGTELNGFDKILIHNNIIANTYDDGIENGLNGVSFYENTLGDNLYSDRGHPDGLQFYGQYYKIYNNYFHGVRNAPGNSVIYIEPGGSGEGFTPFGHVWIYNNYFYETATENLANGAIMIAISGNNFVNVSDIKILNNTIVGHNFAIGLAFTGANLGGSGITDYYIENNIVDSGTFAFDSGEKPGDSVTYVSHGELGSVVIDYNDFYNTNYTGDDNDHGIFSNPLLNSGRLSALSSAINIGRDWSSLFTSDRAGTSRPQGSAWDIGAYEYVESASDTTAPGAPAGLSVR